MQLHKWCRTDRRMDRLITKWHSQSVALNISYYITLSSYTETLTPLTGVDDDLTVDEVEAPPPLKISASPSVRAPCWLCLCQCLGEGVVLPTMSDWISCLYYRANWKWTMQNFFFLFHHLITPNVNEWKLPGNSRQKFYNITDFVPLLQSVWMRRCVS